MPQSSDDEGAALRRRRMREITETTAILRRKLIGDMKRKDEEEARAESSDDEQSSTAAVHHDATPAADILEQLLDAGSAGNTGNVVPPKPPVVVESLDPKLVGMSVGLKNLYSGKEDRHGRFQWQDKIPEDVRKPAEDAETQKWALIIRYVKVYNDPRKTLGIHSIVVQSPLLKKLLEGVLKGYPGVTVGLQRLEFSGKFEPLIHRFSDLKAAIEALKQSTQHQNNGGTSEEKSISTEDNGVAKTDEVHTDSPAASSESSPEATEVTTADRTPEEPIDDKVADTEVIETTATDITADESTSGEPTSSDIGNVTTADEAVDESTSDKPVEDAVVDQSENKSAAAAAEADEVGKDNKDALKLEHAILLHDILVGEFQSLIDDSLDMKAKAVMTFDYLWTLFQPDTLVFSKQDGQERVFRMRSAKYGVDKNDNPIYLLILAYVDYDGTKFGYQTMHVAIPTFAGTRSIASLAALPLEFHEQQEELKERLVARGAKIEAYAGTHYRSYEGIGWKLNSFGDKERHSVKGRIIIDALGWNRYNPDHATFVTPLNRKEKHSTHVHLGRGSPYGSSITQSLFTMSATSYDDEYDESNGGIPMDGHFVDDENAPPRAALTHEQKLVCTPLLRAYTLKEKQWLNLFVNSVHDVAFNSRAFDSLVIPENQKELILGFTATQQGYRNAYDDVIEGKGRGIIILLCGPPGVGKTLTAESVAEEMKVPLFIMSAGDLGIDSRNIEARLLSVLGMCTRWNAILLLDEAEIFLEERSLHELERNKIVSIFLRVLEYHEGIMFLTTNRVQTFDPAFQSRIHISLDYPELSIESRLTVWKNFLAHHNVAQAAARERPPKNPVSAIKPVEEPKEITEEELTKRHLACTQPHTITSRQLDTLSLMNMNGRQIKNVLKTAQLLASRKGEGLKHAHITTVLEVTQHLHNANRENERTRNSLFN